MSASMLQSFSGLMNGVGKAATPGMQQAGLAANNQTMGVGGVPLPSTTPRVTPGMMQDATVAGVGADAPSSLTVGLDPTQIIAQSLAQQSSPMNIAMQSLNRVGSAFIDKNVMPKQLAPPASPFGMATSRMGPLQLSPLLNYLSMLGRGDGGPSRFQRTQTPP